MPNLTPGDGQDLLARLKRAAEQRDVDLALAQFREDAELRGDPFEEPLVGANAIRAAWNDAAATRVNVEMDAEQVWAVGTTVLARWHGAYTRRSDAHRIRQRGFLTIELDDAGLIARMREWTLTRDVGIDSSVQAEGDADPGATHGG
ncbi:MAG: nuclear transport factor 2 family protein [Chloroflexi bacterium]|nr:nuclear transport factor 2 family protein [Chloroflexota bacterium]